jgi:hypothetical protein
MAEVRLIPVTKDGYRMNVHPDALEAYLKTGWVVMETKEQTGGGSSLKDTTAESGQKKAAKKAEVK